MPAIACIAPHTMKRILHLYGWVVIGEDEFNWVLAEKNPASEDSEPVVLPKLGDLLALDVQMDIMFKTKLDLHTYAVLKQRVTGETGLQAEGFELDDKAN
jgi:hypothetical protein